MVSAGYAGSFGYEVIVRHDDGRYTNRPQRMREFRAHMIARGRIAMQELVAAMRKNGLIRFIESCGHEPWVVDLDRLEYRVQELDK